VPDKSRFTEILESIQVEGERGKAGNGIGRGRGLINAV